MDVQMAGYTSLGMALALPEGGKIYACDISDDYPAVGRKLLQDAIHLAMLMGLHVIGDSKSFVLHFKTLEVIRVCCCPQESLFGKQLGWRTRLTCT